MQYVICFPGACRHLKITWSEIKFLSLKATAKASLNSFPLNRHFVTKKLLMLGH